MRTDYHSAEIVCTDFDADTINAEIKDREGNTANLFFESLDDLDLLVHELKGLAESIRDLDPAPGICGACEGSGMGMTPMDTCMVCAGEGETL